MSADAIRALIARELSAVCGLNSTEAGAVVEKIPDHEIQRAVDGISAGQPWAFTRDLFRHKDTDRLVAVNYMTDYTMHANTPADHVGVASVVIGLESIVAKALKSEAGRVH